MLPIPRRQAITKGRAAVFWMAGLFVVAQAALSLWVVRGHPEYCDPPFNYRLDRLRARMCEAPGHPLVLVVGSSRPANGFAPEALADIVRQTERAPVVFNFAALGGGPVREVLTLRRLLACGIRPEWVLVEVWPMFWADRGRYAEQDPVMRSDLHWTDVPVLNHVYHMRWGPISKVLSEVLSPAYHYRGCVIREYLPLLARRTAAADYENGKVHFATLDDWGWLPIPWPRPAPAQFAENLVIAKKDLDPAFEELQKNGLKPHVDWALRKLLRTCRREGIKVAMFYMPEHPALRTWYPPHSIAQYTEYLDRLGKEYGLPIVDARDWVAEPSFVDFCHLLPDGARQFSSRFGREVIRPLLGGQPLPPEVLLQRPAPNGMASSSGSRTEVP
jgi:hypothetical protein